MTDRPPPAAPAVVWVLTGEVGLSDGGLIRTFDHDGKVYATADAGWADWPHWNGPGSHDRLTSPDGDLIWCRACSYELVRVEVRGRRHPVTPQTVIRELPPEEVRRALESLRRPHLNVEGDCWFSCPLATWENGSSACCNDQPKVCDCGAETHNGIVDFLLDLVVEPPP